MKKQISRLAGGHVSEPRPRPELLQSAIEETIVCGKPYRGELRLSSGNQLAFRGLAYSDDERIVIHRPQFSGSHVVVEYSVAAEKIFTPCRLTGRFTLVTNGGELFVPYVFHVCEAALTQEEFPQTPQELALMATDRPDFMLHFFESPAFRRLDLVAQPPMRAVYDGLRRGTGRAQALEEFLTASGAKPAARLTVDETTRVYHIHDEDARDSLAIGLDSPGLVRLAVSVQGEFIELYKEVITSLDFLGNECELPFTLRRARMHPGLNRGRILLNDGKTLRTIMVEVYAGPGLSDESRRRQQYRRRCLALAGKLIELYGAVEKSPSLQADIMAEWNGCASLREPDAFMRLLQAELCRLWGRNTAGLRILEEIQSEIQRSRMQNITAYLWFLYLRGELSGSDEEKHTFLRLLERYVSDGLHDPYIFLLQLRAGEQHVRDREAALYELKNYFNRRQLPAVLCLEACRLYNEKPGALTMIGAFEKKVLLFGASRGCLTRETARQAAMQIQLQCRPEGAWLRVLTELYEQYPEKELLHAVCQMLIRAGCREPYAHRFYAAGVEADIRLAQLYEYYLETLPEDFEGELPQMVLLYFSYNSPSFMRAKQMLYRHIIRRFDADGKIYGLYHRQMQDFALERLLAGDVSEARAELYARVFIPSVLEPRLAAPLTELLHMFHIQLPENSVITSVIAVYGELRTEYSYSVREHEAFVPIYTKNCRLLFADAEGNRYWSVKHKKKRLMPDCRDLLKQCMLLCRELPMLRVAQCARFLETGIRGLEDLNLLQSCLQLDMLHPDFCRTLLAQAARCCAERSDVSSGELYLLTDSPYLDSRSAALLTDSLIRIGDYAKADELIARFGYRDIAATSLLQLCDRKIKNGNHAFEKRLLEMTVYLYRENVFDEFTLTYLCRWYNAGTEEMQRLLQRAEQGRAAYYDMPERLLAQMLFTGRHAGIEKAFALYTGGTSRADKLLLNAYLAVQSSRYFLDEAPADESAFEFLQERMRRESSINTVPVICRLALMKYYAGKPRLEEEARALGARILADLYHKGLIFPYMKQLGRHMPIPSELRDKIWIGFQSGEASGVEISLHIVSDMGEQTRIASEMPHIYAGFFVKSVLLFSGETLEYAIYTTKNGVKELAEQGRISGEAQSAGSGSRFARLNRLLGGIRQADDAAWQRRVIEYGIETVLADKYFGVPI